MSFSTYNAEARHLLQVDKAHRAAKQSRVFGKQLLPVGKISRFLTVCFAVAIGSLMLLPVDTDLPINVIVITGFLLATYAPFSGVWLRVTDFERLHAPAAGLLLFRLRRLLPLLLLIGAIWAGMLSTRSDNLYAILAIGVMPIAMSLAHMLRATTVAFAVRVLIAASFLLGWIQLVDWLPIVALVLDVVVVAWFVRDLAAYDKHGFDLAIEYVHQVQAQRDEIAQQRELPDLRASKRRSLLASAWLVNLWAQRDLVALWQKRPLSCTVSNVLVAVLWLAPVWLAVIAVWRSADEVALLWCVLATVLSMSLLQLEKNDQLYLWGVDMRSIECHNVMARLFTVALPSVAAAIVATSLLGGSQTRWIAVLLVLGLQLTRVGISAFNVGTRFVLVVLFVIGTLIAGASVGHDVAFYAASGLVAFGLFGILARLLRREDALREHAFA